MNNLNESQQELVFDVFENVLEQYSFLFLERVEKEEITTEENSFARASLSFTGPKEGLLSLTIPDTLAIEMAGNVLGIDPEDEKAQQYAHDALKELINVFLGQLLTTLYGENQDYDFGVPVCETLDHDQWDHLLKDPISHACMLDDYPALLVFQASSSLDSLN